MQFKNAAAVAVLSSVLIQNPVQAAEEILVENNKNVDMVVSIYNNNLGFVRDTRNVALGAGLNSIAFEGVASQIKAETAVLTGSGVNVLEQNYDYDLLTPNNILEQFVGKEVKTVIQNPTTGENIFDKAVVLNNNYGAPILRFSYGVEANFPGRVVYDKVPSSLRVKPTLVVNLNNADAGSKNLELAYLTNGISWKADYIAEIKSDEELGLNTWITLNNETGADYENATVQLVSGSVNQVYDAVNTVRPMLQMKMARGAMMDGAAVMETGSVERASLSDYYLYTLPHKTTIKDKQSKQVSMMNLENVKYENEYVMQSPLYISVGARSSDFEKSNPNVVFKLKNEKSANLGEPLPGGVVRFYEKDARQNLQFIGESRIEQSAVGEKIDLTIGKAFDVFAKGKIVNIRSISENISEFDVEVAFTNASEKVKKIVFEQNIYDKWDLLKESMKSEKKNSSTLKWRFDLPKNEKKVLTYTVRVTRNK